MADAERLSRSEIIRTTAPLRACMYIGHFYNNYAIRDMIKINKLVILFLTSFPTLNLLANDGSPIGISVKTRQDIDYRLNTLGLSASLITPVGLFRCDPGMLSGKSRIDSFNNIIGISDVREAEWKDFSAHDLECRYGAKWHAAEGVFKGGFGFRNYLGKTADEPGGKRISIEGMGALLDYDSETLDTKLEWTREIHDYTLRHQASFGDYDSLIDATEDTYTLSSQYKRLYLNAKHVSGDKDNVYTTPIFPTNKFSYAYTDVALGLTFDPEADGITLFAPIVGRGSYRGSFNPLSGDPGLKGVELAGRIDRYDIDISVVRHKGEGSRPYLPATEKLTEHTKSTTISMHVKRDDWSLALENSKSTNTGYAAIAHPLYAAILGGYGPFENIRDEDKWTLSISFPIQKKITADFSFYHTTRHDQQYTHPEHDYIERGGYLELRFRE